MRQNAGRRNRVARWTAAMLLLAAGCGITTRNAQIREWIGRPESALVAAWGPPQTVTTDRKGQRLLIYEWETDEWVDEPGKMWTDSNGVTRWTPPQRRQVTTREVRRFVVDPNGKIIDGAWRFY